MERSAVQEQEQATEATLKYQDGSTAASTAEATAAATKAMEQLRQSWGPNFEANKVIADNAYAAMMQAAGFTQEQMTAAVQKLGEVTGAASTMTVMNHCGADSRSSLAFSRRNASGDVR